MTSALIGLLIVTPVLYAIAFQVVLGRPRSACETAHAAAPPRKLLALDELAQGYQEILADVARRLGLQGAHIVAAEKQVAQLAPPHADLAAQLCEMVEQNQRLNSDLQVARQQLEDRHKELQRAKAESRIDHLTQLPNRRAFEEKLADLQARYERHLEGYALAVFDIDRFKTFNDSHGHAAGDAMLQTIGKAAQAVRRSGDFLARTGGEEFVIVLPRLTTAQAQIAVERYRKAIAATTLRTAGRLLNVTASFGVAAVEPGEAPGEVLARADQALYRAKSSGRNQACVYDRDACASAAAASA